MGNHNVYVVTGALGVLGNSIAQKLALEGNTVFGIDRPRELESDFDQTFTYSNVENWKESFSSFMEMKGFSTLDGLVLVHGEHEVGTLSEDNLNSGSNVMQSNFLSSIEYFEFLVNYLKPGSQIFLMGSIVSLYPLPYSPVYSASKSAINSYFVSLQRFLRQRDVYLKILIVGNINTGFNEKGLGETDIFNQISKADIARVKNYIHSSRGISPDRIVNKSVALLKSPRSRVLIYGRNAKVLSILLRIFGFNVVGSILDFVFFKRYLFRNWID